MRVYNMTSNNGNKVPNQFIIEDDNKVIFQSYNSTIAVIDYEHKTIEMGKNYNYSMTTSKYRNRFFNDEGFYEVANLKALNEALKVGGVMINHTWYEVAYL